MLGSEWKNALDSRIKIVRTQTAKVEVDEKSADLIRSDFFSRLFLFWVFKRTFHEAS